MAISTTKLMSGQRYLFYQMMPEFPTEDETGPIKYIVSTFRANFLDIVNNNKTLRVTLYWNDACIVLPNENPNCIHTIPLKWITNIESLEDIIGGKTVLSPDNLDEIDNYLI